MSRSNILMIVTDQQRAPQHWPDEPGWLDELMPADAELRRSGTSFTRAFVASCMCSPSRASLLTGRYPARHGVPLTMTDNDLLPDPRNVPAVLASAAGLVRHGEAPAGRVAAGFARGLLRRGPRSGHEPELRPGLPTLGTLLRERGYHVALKGKWHLTKAHDDDPAAHGARVARDFGFADWEGLDAGGDAKPASFGDGLAAWDERYTSEAEAWLRRAEIPEPFCLVVSLVNPHDVIGYPSTFARGGYRLSDFDDLHVPLPPTVDETLRDKPTVQAMAKMGQAAYIGEVRGRRRQERYVAFYAHLHRLVDRKLARLLAALGDPADPSSLRSRTVIVRTSDHGEMGLAHGGLRQKVFNAYEEAIRVPLVVSGPGPLAQPRESDALVSLVDVVPTLLALTGEPPPGDAGFDGHDLGPILRGERAAVRDATLFTYDDHQAGTAFQEAPGQPNRIRCVRDARHKYAVYLDPTGREAPEYELYDLDEDPHETRNLVDKRTGRGRTADAQGEAERLHARLRELCAASGTLTPALP